MDDKMTDPKRRTLLKKALGLSLVNIAAGAGLLSPLKLIAAKQQLMHNLKSLDKEVVNLVDYTAMRFSSAITLSAPDIAETGAKVSISISSNLPDVESISILLEKKPPSLVASFNLEPGTNAFVRTWIKIPVSSEVIAIVRSKGKQYFTKRLVKVTTAGCGG